MTSSEKLQYLKLHFREAVTNSPPIKWTSCLRIRSRSTADFRACGQLTLFSARSLLLPSTMPGIAAELFIFLRVHLRFDVSKHSSAVIWPVNLRPGFLALVTEPKLRQTIFEIGRDCVRSVFAMIG